MAKYELYGIRHCYLEYNISGTLNFKRVWMSEKCAWKVNNGKLEFSGDGKKYAKNYGYQASGSVETSVDDDSIDAIIWNTPVVTPLSGDDFAKRFIKGSDAEMQTNFVGLRLTLDGADIDAGTPIVCRYRMLKVQFSPDTPPDFGSEKIEGRMLSWDARVATTDVVGGAISGMPSRGAFWLKDWITDPTKFDPVPNDVL